MQAGDRETSRPCWMAGVALVSPVKAGELDWSRHAGGRDTGSTSYTPPPVSPLAEQGLGCGIAAFVLAPGRGGAIPATG